MVDGHWHCICKKVGDTRIEGEVQYTSGWREGRVHSATQTSGRRQTAEQYRVGAKHQEK